MLKERSRGHPRTPGELNIPRRRRAYCGLNAAQLTASGLGVLLEGGLAPQASILSMIPPASFAGIALGVMPWLLAGGTLALHHGCDPKALDAQGEALGDATLVLPGPALTPLADDGRLLAFKSLTALWRAPERLANCAGWYCDAALVDAAAFGEAGLLAGKRGADGKPAPIPLGLIGAPRGSAGAATIAETARTRFGTLALRGPMVPALSFPAAAPLSPDGYLDTGFTCASADGALIVTGPPAGITAIGGYRFVQAAVDALVAEADPAATIMAVPDGLLGQRLAGQGLHCQRLREANPLIAGAFPRQIRAA